MTIAEFLNGDWTWGLLARELLPTLVPFMCAWIVAFWAGYEKGRNVERGVRRGGYGWSVSHFHCPATNGACSNNDCLPFGCVKTMDDEMHQRILQVFRSQSQKIIDKNEQWLRDDPAPNKEQQ